MNKNYFKVKEFRGVDIVVITRKSVIDLKTHCGFGFIMFGGTVGFFEHLEDVEYHINFILKQSISCR